MKASESMSKLGQALKHAFNAVRPVAIPDRSGQPFLVKDPFKDIELASANEDIVSELRKNNQGLREANQALISTLNSQHETNLALQRSANRTSVVNLIMVVFTVIMAGVNFFQTSSGPQVADVLLESSKQLMLKDEQIENLLRRMNDLEIDIETLQQQHLASDPNQEGG